VSAKAVAMLKPMSRLSGHGDYPMAATSGSIKDPNHLDETIRKVNSTPIS
jgi:hypothetical protein